MALLLAECERDLRRGVDELKKVCTGRGLKVDAGNSKVFERREVELFSFSIPCRV